MRIFSICFIIIFKVLSLSSQAFDIIYHQKTSEDEILSYRIELSENPNIEFYAISLRLEGKAIQNQNLKISINSEDASYNLSPFADQEDNDDIYITNIVYLDPKEFGQLTLSIQGLSIEYTEEFKIKVRVFAPSVQEMPQVLEYEDKNAYNECLCPKPNHITRIQWGTTFNLTSDIYIPPAAYTPVTHLIVHHSAGNNTSSNWSAVVASIFDFHVNTNGWQDVGYNWLIDPNGIIYEGRGGGDNVRGAHMCGYNNNTMGVCVLGNFELIEPTEDAIEALERLLAWKSCQANIDPTGSKDIVSHFGNMMTISGHQDGCRPGHTACPGNFFVPKLDKLRMDTKGYIDDNCAKISNTEEESNDLEIFLYPNPSSDYACCNQVISEQVFINDVFGNQIIKYVEDNCFSINDVANGIYIVQFYIQRGEWIHKKLIVNGR